MELFVIVPILIYCLIPVIAIMILAYLFYKRNVLKEVDDDFEKRDN